MIKSTDYQKNSPEWTLAKFFEAWEKRTWKKMLNYCQITWCTIPGDRRKKLYTQFRHKFISVKLIKIEEISDVTRDISVEIYYKDINIRRKMRRKVRLICELGRMQPSVDGIWGVNPASMIWSRR